MRKRLLHLIAGGSVGALLFVLVAPSTAGAQATTETETLKGVEETFVDELPCVDGDALITITYNAVFHFTENKNGEHFTGTLTGTFVADPIDPSLPTYRGRFTQWFGDNGNRQNFAATFTFSVTGKGDDGSRIVFSEVAHFNTNANGDIASEFDKPTCSQPAA